MAQGGDGSSDVGCCGAGMGVKVWDRMGQRCGMLLCRVRDRAMGAVGQKGVSTMGAVGQNGGRAMGAVGQNGGRAMGCPRGQHCGAVGWGHLGYLGSGMGMALRGAIGQ